MTAWQRAATCFELPVVWLAVGLLLLNDHYLKTAVPSWFTGKLSDFAGLFFFPLLLAVLFSPLGERLRLSLRQIGGVAFGVTAVWFALMKTSSLVNAATIALWQLIVQWPVRIVLDPTDLVALVMLWPAWRIWSNAPHSPWRSWHWSDKPVARLLPLAVIAIAGLATLATSPLIYSYAVRLALVEDRLYVGLTYNPKWPSLPTDKGWYVRGCDADFNCSEPVPEVSDELWLALRDGGPETPVCLNHDPRHCYRPGHEIVEVSTDGGQSWQIAWQIPPGRREYMDRVASSGLLSQRIDMGPYDLLVLPTVDNKYVIVAALGTEGILIRTMDGTWERKSVDGGVAGELSPTSFAAENLGSATFAIPVENGLWLVFWALLLLVPFSLNWINVAKKTSKLIGVLLFCILAGLVLAYNLPNDGSCLSLFFFSFFFGFFFGYLVLGAFAIGMAAWWWQAGERRQAFWFWLLGLILGLAAFISMILWSLGTISFYNTAKTVSLILGAVAILPSSYSALLGLSADGEKVD